MRIRQQNKNGEWNILVKAGYSTVANRECDITIIEVSGLDEHGKEVRFRLSVTDQELAGFMP